MPIPKLPFDKILLINFFGYLLLVVVWGTFVEWSIQNVNYSLSSLPLQAHFESFGWNCVVDSNSKFISSVNGFQCYTYNSLLYSSCIRFTSFDYLVILGC